MTVAVSPPPELVFTDPDGFRLQYHDVGAGPVLVMLHGGGPGASAWSNFKQNVEPLARHYRLLLVDQPGFGGSDKPEHELPQHELTAHKLIGLLDHLGLAKVTPVGNSIGGAAALELALTAPDRVEALVLMAPAGGSLPILAQPSPEARLLFDFYNGPGATPDRMRQLLTGMVYDARRIDEDTLAERLKAASDPAAAEYSRRLFGAWGRSDPRTGGASMRYAIARCCCGGARIASSRSRGRCTCSTRCATPASRSCPSAGTGASSRRHGNSRSRSSVSWTAGRWLHE